MARKKAESLEDVRQDVKKRYRQGTKKHRELIHFESLSDAERWLVQERACLLKAAGFSYTYIAEAVDSTRGTVKGWFEQPAMQARVAEFQADFIDGAVKLVKTYAIEIFEMLMDIARDGTIDPKTRIQAMVELLDRMGLSKVNKSESAATLTKRSEVDITDKTGLMSAMADAPPEVQQEMAAKLEEALALAAEHTDRDVTHA